MPRIKCPRCEKVLRFRRVRDLPYFPFCSERCKMVDLGKWLDGEYRIGEDIRDSEGAMDLEHEIKDPQDRRAQTT